MLTFTAAAREQILAYMEGHYAEDPALRIALAGGSSPLAPEFEFSLVEADDREADDAVVDGGGFPVYLASGASESIEGGTIDYVVRPHEAGFEVRKPPAGAPQAAPERGEAPSAPPTGPVAERVQHVIEPRINPGIAMHGGRITLVDVQDSVVFLQMSGGCQGCGMAQVTLKQGVERMIKDAVPEITEIRDVTDHGAGTNPYFQASK
jgi:Fe/S biogenesis protein NfuA